MLQLLWLNIFTFLCLLSLENNTSVNNKLLKLEQMQINLENRIWKLEQTYMFDRREIITLEHVRTLITNEQIMSLRSELNLIKDMSLDSKILIRDGTTRQPSILARLLHNEDTIREFKVWQKEQKSSTETNQQLMWGLGISILGHVVTITWTIIQWWIKRQAAKRVKKGLIITK